jgi:alpha-1,6-mannosyltransferase
VKIVDVSEFYAERGGGVRTYTHHKLRAAQERGHEVVVLAPGVRGGEERRDGGRIVWIESPRLPVDRRYGVFVSPRAVHAAIARERPDLVEASSPWSGALCCASYPGSVPKAMVFHQDAVAVYGHTLLDWGLSRERIDSLCSPYWRLLRKLTSDFDLTVTAGEWLAQRLQEQGITNARAVPFGCDKTPFDPGLRDEALRARTLAELGLPADATLLVAVSRHHPEKRLHTLCEAVARLRERHPVGLVIYGDGPMRPLVERWARRSPGIRVAGFTADRAELARMLASADALLHGSAAETYGIAVAEALCSGLPVVVPDRGGAAELAGPECSESYPAGDVDACARAVERLMARPASGLRAAAVAHSRVAVRDADEHFDSLFALYEQVANGMATARSRRADHARVD